MRKPTKKIFSLRRHSACIGIGTLFLVSVVPILAMAAQEGTATTAIEGKEFTYRYRIYTSKPLITTDSEPRFDTPQKSLTTVFPI